MEFSLSPVDSGGDVRMLKQCRPILELGDDRQEHSRSMKLSRTDSFSSARQQESNSSPSPDDHQSSSTLMGTDPHAGGMIYQQQYSSRPLFQQQQGSYSSPYSSIKQSSHFSSSPGFQQQQQQQQLHYFPFTASQWAELEHQALIFKYMMARAPVPPELVIPIRRSLILTPSPTNSWSGFQLGVGSGSPMDAEPGRCRRTDGKKWRCSRPVVVDQKYCERHMHRGRNRSRKAAEAAAAAAAVGTTANSTAATAAANTATSTANNGGAKSSAFSSSGNKGGGMAGMETGLGSYHYPLQTSHGDLASKDQRFVNGMSKAGFDPLRPEQLLFAEVSGSCTRPLGGSSSTSASRLVHHQDIGSMHMFGSSPAQEHGLHMHRHSSSNSSKPSPLIRGIERKPEALRHFLDDDWPRVDDSTSIAAGFKTVPSSSSTGIFSLALDEEREQERDRGGAEDGHRHHQSDRSSQDEEQEEAYTHMSLATSGGSGDLLSELLLKSPKPPPLGNATKMVLASPTGVLQRLTCFSDSSSSASSPGSVKNDANHAQ